jgi:hypothetical protein
LHPYRARGQNEIVRIPSAAAIRWTVGAAVLAAALVCASWFLSRLEHRAYGDVLVTTVEVGCEADEIRQVGVEAFLWHTDGDVCVPTLTRAEVEPVGDAIFVTLFERCRRSGDAPVLTAPGVLPRYVFVVPVRWKRPGPSMYANEFAGGQLTQPRPIKYHPSCGVLGVTAKGVAL